MKQMTAAILMILIFLQTLHSQDSVMTDFKNTVSPGRQIYKIIINPGQTGSSAGYLARVTDSSVYLYSVRVQFSRSDLSKQQKFDYRNLQEIELFKKGRIAKGIWIGAVTGLAAGLIVGALTYRTPHNENEYSIGPATGLEIPAAGIFGSVIGIGAGAIIGALTVKTFYINGESKNLSELKEYLRIK
jgi:hypothetical protein